MTQIDPTKGLHTLDAGSILAAVGGEKPSYPTDTTDGKASRTGRTVGMSYRECPICGTAISACCAATVAATLPQAAPQSTASSTAAVPQAAAAPSFAGKKAFRSKAQPLNYEEPNFKSFWEAYPLKRGKASAAKKFAAAVAAGAAPQIIIAAALRYRNDSSRDAAFTKWPEGWLAAKRWEDDDDSAPVDLAEKRAEEEIERTRAYLRTDDERGLG